jgi:hypothetical protein
MFLQAGLRNIAFCVGFQVMEMTFWLCCQQQHEDQDAAMANIAASSTPPGAVPPEANGAAPPVSLPSFQQWTKRKCVCNWGPICQELQSTLLEYCLCHQVNHVALGLMRITNSTLNQRTD